MGVFIETPCTFADIPNFHIRGSDDGFQHHLNLCSNKVKLHFIYPKCPSHGHSENSGDTANCNWMVILGNKEF